MNFADEFYNKIKKELLVPTLFFLSIQNAAIFFAFEYMLNLPGNAIIGFILLLFSLLMAYPIYKNSIETVNYSKNPGNIKKFIIFILTSLTIALITLVNINKYNNPNMITKQDQWHKATIDNIIKKRYRSEVILKIYNNKKTAVKAIAYFYDEITLHENDEVIIKKNPIEIKYNKNNNYDTSLILKGYKYKLFLKKNDYKIIKKSELSIFYYIKRSILNKIKLLFNPEASQMVQALVTGNKNCISKNTIQQFKKAGVLHVLAASGLHVGIIAFIPFILLRPLRINKKIILVFTLNMMFFYIMLTTMPISLIRSIMMFSIFAILHIIHRQKNIFNALFLSAIIILTLFPGEIKSAGFHLSFGATMGILLFFNIYKKSLKPITLLLTTPISLSLSAMVIVYPIIFFHMNEINLVNVPSNLIIVPIISLIMMLSISAIIISYIIPIAAIYVGKSVNIIYDIIIWTVKQFSSLHGHFYVEELNYIIILCYIVFILPIIPFKKINQLIYYFLIKSSKLLIRIPATRKQGGQSFFRELQPFPLFKVPHKLNKYKTISVFICSFFPIIILWIFLNSNKMENKKIFIIKNTGNNTLLIKENNRASIVGEITNYQQYKEIIDIIKKSSVDFVQLYIINPDYINIKYFSSIARKLNIGECFLSTRWIPAEYMENLFKVLKEDNVDLKFKNLSQKNISF